MVKGYSIDFLENPYQTRETLNANMSLAQEILVEQEINVVGKGCHSESNLSKELVCQLSILGVENRWQSEASYKTQGIKPINH